jgi:hypothetical protein
MGRGGRQQWVEPWVLARRSDGLACKFWWHWFWLMMKASTQNTRPSVPTRSRSAGVGLEKNYTKHAVTLNGILTLVSQRRDVSNTAAGPPHIVD